VIPPLHSVLSFVGPMRYFFALRIKFVAHRVRFHSILTNLYLFVIVSSTVTVSYAIIAVRTGVEFIVNKKYFRLWPI